MRQRHYVTKISFTFLTWVTDGLLGEVEVRVTDSLELADTKLRLVAMRAARAADAAVARGTSRGAAVSTADKVGTNWINLVGWTVP